MIQDNMASQFNLLEPLDFSNGNISENWKLFKQELRLYWATEKLKEPNDVETSILLNCIGKQSCQIYKWNELQHSNDKIQGILYSSKKFYTSPVQISHFSTMQGRKIQQLHKQVKNTES